MMFRLSLSTAAIATSVAVAGIAAYYVWQNAVSATAPLDTTTNEFSLLDAVGTMKAVALTADSRLKMLGQAVKFHQVDAAVALAIRHFLENSGGLSALFGAMTPDVSEEIATYTKAKCDNIDTVKDLTDDKALNAVVSGGPAFKIIDAYFPPEMLDEAITTFDGKLVINSSFGGEITDGTLVNVVMTLSEHSTTAVTEAAKTAISTSSMLNGATIGRLTGTGDLTERHVSFALRIPYTPALAETVATLNKSADLTGTTAGKLKIVVPPDIRAEYSAVSLVDKPTVDKFRPLQKEIAKAAGKEGNRLPPLHITQANKQVKTNTTLLDRFVSLTNLTTQISKFGLTFDSPRSTSTVFAASPAKVEDVDNANHLSK